jgi:transposase
VLKAQINKTDRNDARGIAQMMRVGLSTVAARAYPLQTALLRLLCSKNRMASRGAFSTLAVLPKSLGKR